MFEFHVTLQVMESWTSWLKMGRVENPNVLKNRNELKIRIFWKSETCWNMEFAENLNVLKIRNELKIRIFWKSEICWNTEFVKNPNVLKNRNELKIRICWKSETCWNTEFAENPKRVEIKMKSAFFCYFSSVFFGNTFKYNMSYFSFVLLINKTEKSACLILIRWEL